MRGDGLVDWKPEPDIDVLLAVPPPPATYAQAALLAPEFSAPPLGIAYIAAALQSNGHRVAIVDLHQQGAPPEAIIASCRRYSPKIVGITASTPTYPNALSMARFVKAWRPECPIVLGGPHATCAPAQCILDPTIDFVCIGEGERPMVDLVGALLDERTDPLSIPGFCIRTQNGQPHFTGQSPRDPSLDSLPFPARDLLDLNAYHQKGSIISSRGCPIGCHFCACAAIAGRVYRAHTLPYVIREMEHLHSVYGCTSFDFHDDTFNLYPARVHEFCRTLKAQGMAVKWGCFCRAAPFTQDMASDMAQAGCTVVQFGVESGSERVLQSIGKRISTAQVRAAVLAASQAGIQEVACGFIVGHPADTEESIRETIEFGLQLRQLGATRLTLSLLTPYPGTSVYENRDQLGVRLLTTDWEQYTFSRVVAENAHLTAEPLRQLYAEGVFRFL